MAVNEGIRSSFPTQPSARSPKLRIYESLFLLNHGVDHVVALLRGMEKFPLPTRSRYSPPSLRSKKFVAT